MFTVYHKHQRLSFSGQSSIPFIASWLIGPNTVTERDSDDQCLGSLNYEIFVAKLFRVGN